MTTCLENASSSCGGGNLFDEFRGISSSAESEDKSKASVVWEHGARLAGLSGVEPGYSHLNRSRACLSARRKVIPDDLAALHDEANVLEFADIGDRISGNRDKIGEFPRLD